MIIKFDKMMSDTFGVAIEGYRLKYLFKETATKLPNSTQFNMTW